MPTGTGGAVGAAAGAARLLGLDAAGVRSAMGLAAAGAGLSRQALADLATGKNVLAGVAAKTGVEAALLARAGAAGAPNFLAGPYGLRALYAGGRGDAAEVVRGLGTAFGIGEVGTKPYPCCRSAHPALDLVFDLLREAPGVSAEVESIRFEVPRGVCERVGRPFRAGADPRTAALFSLPYAAAVALRTGALAPEDFDPDAVLGMPPAVARLVGGVAVEAVPVPGEAADPMVPVRAVFRLADGAEIARTARTVKGAPDRPMTAEEEERKLAAAVGGALPPGDVAGLARAARGVPAAGPAALLRYLRRARVTPRTPRPPAGA